MIIKKGKEFIIGVRVIYDGEWKNGFKEGKGIEYYNDGDIYEGDYKKGKKEGKGIYYWKNGDRY